ncbi:polysaccharide pyruvyl transferase family protein [Gracilimonas amylolytica]|uniref:polysaccharide pyruvyl transferase family protein n=1 Tax=Gracilimonas amylolytica TaxID=1749045 RepID=UPI0013000F9D|nr:polysaccharide pyruvyl transferase family protein [Gracilimonas amylolytica]
MFVEIRGAQTVNKGAELMLLSVIKELSLRFEHRNIIFTVEPQINFSYSKRVKYDIKATPRYHLFGINFGVFSRFLPDKIKRDFGIISQDSIDVVIDVSGFRYGDFWGKSEMVKGSTKYLKKWKNKNVKIIYLPQAFGPFQMKGTRKQAKKILKYADFVAARDKDSFSYLNELRTDVKKKKLFQYPDFTTSISVGEKLDEYKNQILIIPNSKMIKEDGRYISYLLNLIKYLQRKDLNFSFLVHAGNTDFQIANQINEINKSNINIIWHEDPILTKQIIKSSYFLITSRFHGLINGLSQGVPSISTSWSHKYERVLEEYDFKDMGLINDLDNFDKTEERIERIISDYEKIKKHLLLKSEIHKKKVDEMWERVVAILDEK